MTATTVAPTQVRINLTSTTMNTAQLETVLGLNPGVAGNDTLHGNKLVAFLEGGLNRCYPQNLTLSVGAAPAVGTITITSTGPTATETLTVGNVTITAVASGATGNQINVNASPTVVAAELAAVINVALANVIVATAALGVVTLTAAVPGALGNALELANVNFANTAIVAMAGGAEGDAFTINLK